MTSALPSTVARRLVVVGECWLWTGQVTGDGYGRCTVDGLRTGAHRHAWEAVNGPIPEGMVIDHLCHSTDPSCPGGGACQHRRCCNPAHMEVVTWQQNATRGHGPAAVNHRRTHCTHGHLLLPPSNGSKRVCRECLREHHRTHGRPVRAELPPGRYTIRQVCEADGINKRDLWVAVRTAALPPHVVVERDGRGRVHRLVVTSVVSA